MKTAIDVGMIFYFYHGHPETSPKFFIVTNFDGKTATLKQCAEYKKGSTSGTMTPNPGITLSISIAGKAADCDTIIVPDMGKLLKWKLNPLPFDFLGLEH